jgi:hypothetical protein
MFGVLYWAIWKLVLPYVFNFRLVPQKEVLKDGTVVTLVSRPSLYRVLRGIGADRDLVLSRKDGLTGKPV